MLAILALSVALISCGDDDDEGGNAGATYIGTWSSTSVRSFDCNSMEDIFETESDGCYTAIIDSATMLSAELCFTMTLEIRDDMTGSQMIEITSDFFNSTEMETFTYVEKSGNILEICEDDTPDECMEMRYSFNGNNEMTIEAITPDPDTGCLSEINFERQ